VVTRKVALGVSVEIRRWRIIRSLRRCFSIWGCRHRLLVRVKLEEMIVERIRGSLFLLSSFLKSWNIIVTMLQIPVGVF
jgi:hypothetical protein